jgi:hypothetical protein
MICIKPIAPTGYVAFTRPALSARITVSAYAQALCPGLSGQARGQCLQAQVAQSNRDLECINKKLDQIDNAILATCAARLGANWCVGGGLNDALSEYIIQSAFDHDFGVSGACVGAAKRRGLIP